MATRGGPASTASLRDVAAVCFDLGGTIIIDHGGGRKQRLATLLGCDPAEIDAPYRRHFLTRSWTERQALSALGEELGVSDLPQHEHDLDQPLRIYADVHAAIASLSDLTLAIISNCSSRDRDQFATLDISAAFELCVFSCDIGRAKPDPEPFQCAQQLLDLPAERIVHVGDNPIGDVRAASQLGWHAIHIRRHSAVAPCAEAAASITSLSGLARALRPTPVRHPDAEGSRRSPARGTLGTPAPQTQRRPW
jgi:HAD superfamily hydrolase (TIGR01549 family)